MKRFWIVALGFVVYLLLVIGLSYMLHLSGSKLALFITILALLGIAACAFTLWYLKKLDPPTAQGDAGAAELSNLDLLLRDANQKLKLAKVANGKSLALMPLIYILGEENSAKTQTILKSGLDPELLAGQVFRENQLAPTQMINVWLAGPTVLVEAGGALLRNAQGWARLVRLTAPGKFSAALSKSSLQPTRAVVLCVSLERILAPSTSEQIRALGKSMNERLRELSRIIGISLPVYILFTKLDTIPAFSEYVSSLTETEISTPVGAMLDGVDVGAGLYAERATQQIGTLFSEIVYRLAQFRLEILARGGPAANLARSYEFPRDLTKLRAGIVDLLVEVGRPSQLGTNPYLRGFFFSGMRAHLMEDVASVGTQSSSPIALPDVGATRVMSFTNPQPSVPVPVRSVSTRKIAQWVFLPYFFSRFVLADKTALESSRSSTRVSSTKRWLISSLAVILGAAILLITVSFLNNRALEHRALAAAASVRAVDGKEIASVADLQTLEHLRLVLVELDTFHRDGPPLSYRWGLYRGEEVRNATCHAYGQRMDKLLLAQTQENIASRLAALPVKAGPADEYQATYKPLKAWLITTSNPDKSTVDFLAPELQTDWVANRPVSSEAQQLALTQFEYYAAALPEPHSCLAGLGPTHPDATILANTREYLASFAGIDHVYLTMKAAADRKFPPIDFKKLYPGSVRFVAAPAIVDGAFSKDGFAFMQDAIRNPEPYLSGEEWVTGPSIAVDRAQLRQQLPDRYQADFLGAWRTFIKTAHVLPFSGVEDSATRLHELDGPSSPLLQIFGVISSNTSVPAPAFSLPFQAPQSVTPSNGGPPVNPGYTEKLSAIEQAIHAMLANPASANDPSQVNAAVSAAYSSVGSIRNGFQPPDPAGVADSNSERLLREPIKSAEDLAGKVPAKAANGAGAEFCKQVSGVLGKFPFNPDAKVDSSPEEAATMFGQSGPIAQFVAAQSKLISFNGSVYSSASSVQVNPALLSFLNTTHLVGTTLFANGSAQPTLSFAITELPTPNLSAATLDIDGTSYSNINVSNRVSWQYRSQGAIKLAGSGQTKNTFGPWSIFHFAYAAKHPAGNQLEYIFQNNGITEKSQSGVDVIYRFEIEDNGARLLNPDFMRHQLRCVSTVAK